MNAPVLQVRDLSKRFAQTIALRGVTFAVWPGEVFGYLGPNGAGKTTTIRILLGLLKPTGGSAEVFGQDVRSESAGQRQRMGVVLDEPGLYERLSAYDNLEYYARLYGMPANRRRQRIGQLLEQVGLADRSRDRVGTFSRGMKQRLAIARALIHEPDLLFLDEPTAGLDPEGQKEVRDLLLQLVQVSQRTVFLSSHNLNEVQHLCTRIAILRQGELLVCDTLSNLSRRLSSPTVEVAVIGMLNKAHLKAVLHQLDFVTAHHINSQHLQIEITDTAHIPILLKKLIEEGIRVGEAKQITHSLEEVYLTLVKGGD